LSHQTVYPISQWTSGGNYTRNLFVRGLAVNPPNGIIGDLNQDGVVSGDGTGPLGTPDGLVNQLDYQFWSSHFGQALGSGAGAEYGIPEPATFILLLFAAAAFSIQRGRECKLRILVIA
jgi:hypothetical protein